jgi:hypothetical protein
MIESLLIGIGGIVGLMVLWVVVQGWWRKTFREHVVDDDVLAGRTKCGNCGCTTICQDIGTHLSDIEIH